MEGIRFPETTAPFTKKLPLQFKDIEIKACQPNLNYVESHYKNVKQQQYSGSAHKFEKEDSVDCDELVNSLLQPDIIRRNIVGLRIPANNGYELEIVEKVYPTDIFDEFEDGVPVPSTDGYRTTRRKSLTNQFDNAGIDTRKMGVQSRHNNLISDIDLI